jgi:predicted ATP-binding protein involved in virulence
MRLAAIYIKQHDFLFSEPQTINLGGKYIYTITPRKDTENEYDITRKENPDFIEGFWGDKISLVSAIVGENGTGKTSVLKMLLYISEYLNFFLIYENTELFYIQNLYLNSNPIYKFFYNYNPISKFSEKHYQIYLNPHFEGGDLYKTPINRDTDFAVSRILDYSFTNLLRKSDNPLEYLFKNLINELEFCNKFQNFVNDFPFLNYNVKFDFIYDMTNQLTESYYKYYINQYKSDYILESGFSKEDVEHIFDEDYKKYILDFYQFKNEFSNFFEQNRHYYTFDFYIHFILYFKCCIANISIIDFIIDKKNDSNSLDFNSLIIEFLRENKLEDIMEVYEIIEGNSIPRRNGKYPNDFGNNMFYSRSDSMKILQILTHLSNSEFLVNEQVVNSNLQVLKISTLRQLSTGEKGLINLFSNIYSTFSQGEIIPKLRINKTFGQSKLKVVNINNLILFLDEADLGFHPQWKKKYVKILTDFLPIMFAEIPGFESVQIIFTTHDPLTLSDIPNSNVVYLKKDGDKTKVLNEHEKPKKSFGANITDLLADSFFIDDGLIGDFAKGKIEKVIQWLNELRVLKENDKTNKNLKEVSENDKVKYKKIIELIDEPLLKSKLLEMYYELFPNEFDNEKEIEEVRRRAIELGIIKE